MNIPLRRGQRGSYNYKLIDLDQHNEREAYWQKWRVSRQRKFFKNLRKRQANEAAAWAAFVVFISLNSSMMFASKFGNLPSNIKWIGLGIASGAPFLVYFIFRFAWLRMRFNDIDAWQRAVMHDRDIDAILRDR